jgi:hypothetical protein
MRGRTALLGLVCWVTVVVLGAGLVWFVISDVGRAVSTSRALPGRSSSTGDLAPVGTPSASGTPSATPPPRQKGSATSSAAPSRDAASAGVTTAPTPRQAPTSTNPRRTVRDPSPGPRTVVRTWSGTGGTITVACTAATIRLTGASPDDGWRVEQGSRGPEQVEVTFASGTREVQVQASCSRGAPSFRVEREGSDD